MDRGLEKVQNTIVLPVYSTENYRPGSGSSADATPDFWEQAYFSQLSS